MVLPYCSAKLYDECGRLDQSAKLTLPFALNYHQLYFCFVHVRFVLRI